MDLKEIEKDVRRLGDMIEKQIQLVTDPRISGQKAAFEGLALAVRSKKLQEKINKSLGINLVIEPHSTDSLKTLVAFLEGRGSHAGDKIKSLLPKLDQMIQAVLQNDAGGRPRKVVKTLRHTARTL